MTLYGTKRQRISFLNAEIPQAVYFKENDNQ